MSGVFGVFGKSCSKKDLRKIGDTMCVSKHSSISNSKTYADDSTAFYHLSRGDDELLQNEEATTFGVVNGKIYNVAEVNCFLKNRGHRFNSDDKNEILVHLYEESFADPFIFNIIEGAFSFVIWDSVRKQLVLGVDKFGIKPLYYAFFCENLVFASEIKGILNYEAHLKKLNLTVLDLFFSYFYTPSCDTIVDGIRKIMPMTYATFRMDQSHVALDGIVKYFSLNLQPSGSCPDPASLCDAIYNSMLHSVARRTKNVFGPIGISLGGGLDSGLICGLLKKLNKEFCAFTAVWGGGEQKQARSVADYVGCRINEITITSEDYVKRIGEIANVFDEPLASFSIVPSLCIVEEAKKQARQIFTGDGGDELFWGYPWVPSFWLDRVIQKVLPQYARKVLNVAQQRKIVHLEFSNPAHKHLRRIFLPPAQQFFVDHIQKFDRKDLALICARKDGKRVPSIGTLADPVNQCFEEVMVDNDLLKRYYTLFKLSLPESGSGLRRAETICNYNVIHLAMPFLDSGVVALSFHIPAYLKQPNRYLTKYILRKTILKYKLLPSEVIKLRKRGLGDVPIVHWLTKNKDFRNFMWDILQEGFNLKLFKRDLINLGRKNLSTKPDRYFVLAMFTLWYKARILQ